MAKSKLTVGELTNIRYTKEDETTERVVVPTTVPSNIKALDVTGLPEPLQEKIAESYSEYQEYMKQHMKTAFAFEDWVEHSKGIEVTAKWRTFKPENTEVI